MNGIKAFPFDKVFHPIITLGSLSAVSLCAATMVDPMIQNHLNLVTLIGPTGIGVIVEDDGLRNLWRFAFASLQQRAVKDIVNLLVSITNVKHMCGVI